MERTKPHFKSDPAAPRVRKTLYNIMTDKQERFFTKMKEQYPFLSKYTDKELYNYIIMS